MARLAEIHVSDEDDYAATPSHPDSRRVNGVASLSPSPAASFSSDKENQTASARLSRSTNRKSKGMQPPKLPMPAVVEDGTPRAAKRRRLCERGVPNASQVAHEEQLRDVGENKCYDPNQSMEERRAVRKGIRNLSKELTGTMSRLLLLKLTNLHQRIPCRVPNALFERSRKNSRKSERDFRNRKADVRCNTRFPLARIDG